MPACYTSSLSCSCSGHTDTAAVQAILMLSNASSAKQKGTKEAAFRILACCMLQYKQLEHLLATLTDMLNKEEHMAFVCAELAEYVAKQLGNNQLVGRLACTRVSVRRIWRNSSLLCQVKDLPKSLQQRLVARLRQCNAELRLSLQWTAPGAYHQSAISLYILQHACCFQLIIMQYHAETAATTLFVHCFHPCGDQSMLCMQAVCYMAALLYCAKCLAGQCHRPEYPDLQSLPLPSIAGCRAAERGGICQSSSV